MSACYSFGKRQLLSLKGTAHPKMGGFYDTVAGRPSVREAPETFSQQECRHPQRVGGVTPMGVHGDPGKVQ